MSPTVLFEEYANDNHSPVRTQYLQIKRQHPDALLFFRMGDFYEMFDEDAEIVARGTEIDLSRPEFWRWGKTPIVGVAAHPAPGFILARGREGERGGGF